MINVNVNYEAGYFKSLTVKGHANSAAYGHDLVCSAVSAVVTGGFNNIENVDAFKIVLEEGNASIEALKEITDHDKVVIQTIISGLKTIEEADPEFVKIND